MQNAPHGGGTLAVRPARADASVTPDPDSRPPPCRCAVKPIVWQRAIRDAEPKRSAKQLAALWALALRMEANGTGFASAEQLANDAGVHRSTVSRATVAERKAGNLVQTRRGHRISADKSLASGWRLTHPETQRCTSATLAADPTSQTSDPTSHIKRHSEVYLPENYPPPSPTEPQGAPAAAQNGGREPHKNEPNARRAIAQLVTERALPFTAERLLELAYTVDADPWAGYLAVKHHTERDFKRVGNPVKVLRTRLGLKP